MDFLKNRIGNFESGSKTLTILHARSQICLAKPPAKSIHHTSVSFYHAATGGFYGEGDTYTSCFGDFNNPARQLLRGEGEEESRL